ncbi:MAG: hypothetical protein QOG87_2506 [Actinomycetota bacterium]
MIAPTALLTAAVTFDSTVKFVHVLLAILAVGSNLSYGIWLAGAGQAPENDAHALRGIKRLHERVAIPAYVLLGVTGVILLARGPWDLLTPWITASCMLYLVGLVAAVLGYAPALKNQLLALEQRGPGSPGYRSATRLTTIAGGLTATLVVVVTFLMVTKPGG